MAEERRLSATLAVTVRPAMAAPALRSGRSIGLANSISNDNAINF